jgi:tRNA U34 5-carboxymethylaminomethyl modifying enzyme MnmG/GidA
MGIEIPAKSVVLTNGTFLNGLIHIGEKNSLAEAEQAKKQHMESPNN